MGMNEQQISTLKRLMEYEAARTEPPAGFPSLPDLPGGRYTDPRFFELEKEHIWRKSWLFAAHIDEIPDAGCYMLWENAGQPVVIVHGDDGQIYAHYNTCSHRGAPVVTEKSGRKARLTCKYHGWTYSNDGKLIGVADAGKFGDIDKSGRGLRELPCEEKSGLMFVSLTPDTEMNLDSFLDGMLDDLEAHDFANWSYLGQRVITGANWKIAFDGYLEGYHFASLHPDTIHPRTISNLTHYENFGPHMRIGFAQTAIEEKLGGAPKEEWGDMESNGYDFVRILFPNVSLFVAPEITQLAQLFPGPTPDQNRTVLLFFRKDPPKDKADAEGLEGMMDWLRNVVEEEDYLIGEQIQKGLQAAAHESIILGKNERGNQFFHEILEYYMKNDPTLPMPKI